MRGHISGAGDGTRTRDNLLGRQGLYQLSYSRFFIAILAVRGSHFSKKSGEAGTPHYALHQIGTCHALWHYSSISAISHQDNMHYFIKSIYFD